MRSMTGFGVGEAHLDASGAVGRLAIEIRGVNHRFLDLRVKGPSELPDVTPLVESLARERLVRGRFDITVRVDGAALGAVSLDRDRARSVFKALSELRDELAPNAEVPLSLLGSVPDLFVPVLEKHGEALARALQTAFDLARTSLDEMRLREGRALGDDLTRRLVAIRKVTGTIGERAPLVVESYRKRLHERAERLRLSSDLELDAGRLEQEVALYADRVDIAEELTRLEGHVVHFETLLQAEGAVGRRLDFLLQEMAREANTIGSKSQDLTVAHAVVELKAEIERMREQVQNVE